MSAGRSLGALEGLGFLSDEARTALRGLVAELVAEQVRALRAELTPASGNRDEALSVRAASVQAGLSQASVRRAIESGELEAEKLCGRIRIRPQAFESWRTERAVRPRARAKVRRRRTAPAEHGLRVLLRDEATVDPLPIRRQARLDSSRAVS